MIISFENGTSSPLLLFDLTVLTSVATDINGGAISPGGVGYDINCGVRLLKSDLKFKDVAPRIPDLIENIFHNIPSGLGSKGKLRISNSALDRLLEEE